MIRIGPIYDYYELLNMINEEDIVAKYVPNFKTIGKSFRLRDKLSDRKASCRVFNANGRLMINDFGDATYPKPRTIIEFIQDEYHVNYKDACNMISRDFKHSINRKLIINRPSKISDKSPTISDTIIKVKYRDWDDYDLEYWGGYGLDLAWLESANIKPIQYYWITSKRVNNMMFRAEKYAYVYLYYELDGIFRMKIYQPFSEWAKWWSNATIDCVQNLKNIPKQGDLLVIQSSLKDSLVMSSLKFNSIAPMSESSWFTERFFSKINSRFERLIYFADNDWEKDFNSGISYAETISKKYKLQYINTPNVNGVTDISEYRKLYGFNKTKTLVLELIKDLD